MIETGGDTMPLTIEIEQEEDGRWLAEVPALAGVLAYGQTRAEAVEHAQALALRVLAGRLEHGETVPEMGSVFAVML
jgi:predicted RNase H-like HicB family nuclease